MFRSVVIKSTVSNSYKIYLRYYSWFSIIKNTFLQNTLLGLSQRYLGNYTHQVPVQIWFNILKRWRNIIRQVQTKQKIIKLNKFNSNIFTWVYRSGREWKAQAAHWKCATAIFMPSASSRHSFAPRRVWRAPYNIYYVWYKALYCTIID